MAILIFDNSVARSEAFLKLRPTQSTIATLSAPGNTYQQTVDCS